MNRRDQREDIFKDDADRETFLTTLGEACPKTDWQVHAYYGQYLRAAGQRPVWLRVERLLGGGKESPAPRKPGGNSLRRTWSGAGRKRPRSTTRNFGGTGSSVRRRVPPGASGRSAGAGWPKPPRCPTPPNRSSDSGAYQPSTIDFCKPVGQVSSLKRVGNW